MPSPALTAYEAAVAASGLSPSEKAQAGRWGERLYIDTTRETALHCKHHLIAEMVERIDTPELRARANLVTAILDRAAAVSDALALSIAEALDG